MQNLARSRSTPSKSVATKSMLQTKCSPILVLMATRHQKVSGSTRRPKTHGIIIKSNHRSSRLTKAFWVNRSNRRLRKLNLMMVRDRSRSIWARSWINTATNKSPWTNPSSTRQWLSKNAMTSGSQPATTLPQKRAYSQIPSNMSTKRVR